MVKLKGWKNLRKPSKVENPNPNFQIPKEKTLGKKKSRAPLLVFSLGPLGFKTKVKNPK